MTVASKLIKTLEDLSASIIKAETVFESLSVQPASKGLTQVSLEELSTLWRKFDESHDSLVEANHDGKLDDHSYFTSEVRDKTYQSYVKFKGRLIQQLDTFPASASASTQSVKSCSDNHFIPNHRALPKIQMPTFSGKLKEWASFQDHFESLVGSNTGLTAVDKFHYLKGCLHGDAAKLLSNIQLTGENFPRAWKVLCDRYENKRAQVTAHLDSLHALKPLSRKNARELEYLRSSVNSAIEALRGLGGDPTHWDFFLVHLVSKKLDQETHEAWELSLGDSTAPPPYQALDTFLASRVRAYEALSVRESAAFSRQPGTRPPAPAARHQHIQQRPANGARVHAASPALPSASAKRPQLKCFLCTEQHPLCYCPKFREKTPQQKYQLLQETGRCVNCLRANHRPDQCKSTRRCFTCSQPHHTSIHECLGVELNPLAPDFSSAGGQGSRQAPPPANSGSQQVQSS